MSKLYNCANLSEEQQQ